MARDGRAIGKSGRAQGGARSTKDLLCCREGRMERGCEKKNAEADRRRRRVHWVESLGERKGERATKNARQGEGGEEEDESEGRL